MCSLSPVGRSAAANKKDRVSLCSFAFSDGRRCRTPRIGKHPLCFHHAQKEARARTAEKLAKDLSYFFSADYLSACDLSTALATLIPAVVRGDLKPKTAHTVSYMVQTLLQAIHLSKHEYINAFGSDGWRKSIYNSVNDNHDYRFPPDPKPEPSPSPQPQPQPAQPPAQAQQPAQPQTQSAQPAPPPHTPMPSTSAEFVEQVIARLQTGDFPTCPERRIHPAPSGRSQPVPIGAPDPVGSGEPFRSASRPAATPSSPSAPTAATDTTSPAETPVNCHSERREESAFPESQAHLSDSIPATPSTQSAPPTPQPNNPPLPRPSTPRPEPDRSAPWLHFADTRIPPDSKLL